MCRFYLLPIIVFFASCKESKDTTPPIDKNKIEETIPSELLDRSRFDTIIKDKSVGLYWLKKEGIQAAFTNYGARIVGLWVKDKDQKWTDVVVGMASIEAYKNSTEAYYGASIGRVANRIAYGKFTIEGKSYTVPQKYGKHALHGGMSGFQDVVWDIDASSDSTIVFSYLAKDMEEGFPGNLKVYIAYALTPDTGVRIDYKATTDKTTLVNLTNHAFFNLNGEGSGDVLDHFMQVEADYYTPVDNGLIPTGQLAGVAGTVFDFSTSKVIGDRIDKDDPQLIYGNGYDHNFVLDPDDMGNFKKAAQVEGELSGIIMEVYTEEPGMQFYTGNFMSGENKFKSGAKDSSRTAFALETQHFPDAPNQSSFPSILLKPGEEYSTVSEYRFSVK